jgi:hypothetical protein
MTIIVLALSRYVDLKKKRVGYPSVMNFEGQLGSGSQKICDLCTRSIERTYVNEPRGLPDPGCE